MKKFILVAIGALALCTAANASDRRILVRNHTDEAVYSLYGSNVSRGSWEEDILHDRVIPAHSSSIVNFDDGTGYCMFDLKAIMEDGQRFVKPSVNVCVVETWDIWP